MNDTNMFACSYKDCGKIYSTKYSLQRHCLIRHKKSKRFSCKICKKILSSNQNLKEHVYTHSNEKPLVCTFKGCGELFRQSSQLSAHKKLHSCSGQSVNCLDSKSFLRTEFLQFGKMEDERNGEKVDQAQGEIPKLFDPEQLRAFLSSLNQ